ncbi:MAG: Gfo/Idh/MocA family oxidoreductase [Psychrilyobacter sp.]|uniref:Gfo/Idh/MocA family protein n=1 Tax=Psychrilyobacter sp. TaxID=2586924 RepID=UPI003C785DF3
MKKIGIGLIGAWGWRGKLGAYALEEKDVKLIGAADIYDESLEKFSEFYKKEKDLFLTKDYNELLAREDVDAVFILSPDYCHEEHAIAALKAGKDVYLEKPLGITIEECDNILKTAMEEGRKLFLGHNMRYFPVILKMKEVIDSGVIGDIQAVWCRHFVSYGGDAYFKDWHSERKNVNGLLLQKGAHDMDVIHWLAGGYSKAVVGMGKLSIYDKCDQERKSPDEHYKQVTFDSNHWPAKKLKGVSNIVDVEDHSMVMMQLDNGVQASYVQCHYTPDSVRNYTFIGTKGRVENIGDTGDCKVVVYTDRFDGYGKTDVTYDLKEKTGTHGGSDPDIVKAFIRYIKNGEKPNTSPIAARQAVAAGIMATESLRGNGGLKIIPELSKEIIEYFEK